MQLRPVFSFLGSVVRHGSRPLTALILAASPALAAPDILSGHKETYANVSVSVTGLRSDRGVLRACLTPDPQDFPRCRQDSTSIRIVTSAAPEVRLVFTGVKPGRYAIALLHDENNNGRMDRALMMMPREGFGFSRDAPVRMGPPSFDLAAFDVDAEGATKIIRMRYML